MRKMQLKPRPEKTITGGMASDRVNFFMRTGTDLALSSSQPPASGARPPPNHIAHALKIITDDEVDAGECDDSQPQAPPQTAVSLVAHAVLEMIASILLCYSSLYMPNSEHDDLKQYVSATCVFTVVMGLKDAYYFFPDGSPFVTAMLWAATLYTDRRNQTRWDDIRARVLGQFIGWGVVFYLAQSNRDNLKLHADLLTPRSGLWTHCVNEGLGTMLECIAITFATIPLITPYDEDDAGDNAATTSVTEKRRRAGGRAHQQGGDGGAQQHQLIKSKAEADPPTNDALFLVALSLAAIHYALERIFQATMNPFCTCLQIYVSGETNPWEWLGPVLGQIAGAFLAGIYVKMCLPSRDTVRKLLKANKRK
jgi:glycerol uptake facilitator-like aquaporin